MLAERIAMTNVLQFESVTKEYEVGSSFEGNRAIFRALDGVSFAVEPGETVGLVGESGSGKSTIARIATGLLHATSGSVALLGHRIDGLPDRRLRDQRVELGFVFQNPYESLNPRQRIADIVALPLRIHRRLTAAEQRKQVLDLLERVGLAPAEEFGRKLPHQLSGGQRQRVAIARAIALRPRLLIADEPVSALDVSISGQILNLLRDVQEEIGSSILFITHDLALAHATCDRVLVLHRGRIVESGPTTAVLGNPSHPYTLQLMASMPACMTGQDLTAESKAIGPSATGGCLFRDRCPFAMPRCEQVPGYFEEPPEHRAMCWLLDSDTTMPAWRNLRLQIVSRISPAGKHASSRVALNQQTSGV